MMRPHDGRIDHLHAARRTRALGIAALVQGLQHQCVCVCVPYPRQRPAPELPVHRRPFAEILVQVAPRRARPRDPEHPVQNKPVIFRRPTALAAPGNHERREKRPLLVRHQSTNQDRLPKSSLESRLAPFVNPLCQRVLDICLSFNEPNVFNHAGHLRMSMAQKLAVEWLVAFDVNRRAVEALAADADHIDQLEEIENAAKGRKKRNGDA